MERISAVVLSDAYAENIRCLYENDEIMIVHQITNAANGNRDAVMCVFTKEDGMLTRLETEATRQPQIARFAVLQHDRKEVVKMGRGRG